MAFKPHTVPWSYTLNTDQHHFPRAAEGISTRSSFSLKKELTQLSASLYLQAEINVSHMTVLCAWNIFVSASFKAAYSNCDNASMTT